MKISVSAAAALVSCLLGACAQRSAPGNDAMFYNISNTATPLSPGVQPVRIGEGGPAFRACAAIGQVMNLSPSGEAYLPLRSAPFVEGAEIARLSEGTKLYLCTRSLDQHWQGVVVPPDGAAPESTAPGSTAPGSTAPGSTAPGSTDADCGVTGPIAAPRAYTGPCRSGWVASAFVSASAD